MLAATQTQPIDMINTIAVNEHLLVGGQPSFDDFSRLKQLGIAGIINLRPESEPIDFNDVELAEKLGIHYHRIGIAKEEDLTRDNAMLLSKLMAEQKPLLIHCASGNRVGALLALKAYWADGFTADEAFNYGLETGLTKLQPAIKKLLGL